MNRILTAILTTVCSLQAHGYYYRTCDGHKIDWQSNNQTMRAHDISFEQDAMRNALDRQIDRFNFNPSKFRLDLSHGHSSVGIQNDKNEIFFSPDQKFLDNRPGVTLTTYQCTKSKSEIHETDIILQGDFSKVNWTYSDDRASLSSYGGNNRALRTTIMHELGHVGGLLHTIETYGVMGDADRTSNTNGNRARVYLGEDASSGMVKLYNTASINIEDVAVSHWEFLLAGLDPSDDYSKHRRTRVYDSNDMVIEDASNKNGETHYEVKKGQSIKVEFTYENNGQDEQTVDVGFYLSGNNTISTGDLFLRDSKVTIARNSAHTTTRTVKIPPWVPSGFYFIGAIIDYNNKLSEQTGGNNVTYIGIRVLKDNIQI